MDPYLFRRRRRSNTAIFAYVAGRSLSTATFSRGSSATYTESATDTLSDYGAGDSLASATYSRGSSATYTESV